MARSQDLASGAGFVVVGLAPARWLAMGRFSVRCNPFSSVHRVPASPVLFGTSARLLACSGACLAAARHPKRTTLVFGGMHLTAAGPGVPGVLQPALVRRCPGQSVSMTLVR